FCFRRRRGKVVHQIRADFGVNGIDSVLQSLQRLTWRNFSSPEEIPKLDDAERRQIALRHSIKCLTESLKPRVGCDRCDSVPGIARASRAHFGASPKCFSCSTKESRCRGATTASQGAGGPRKKSGRGWA